MSPPPPPRPARQPAGPAESREPRDERLWRYADVECGRCGAVVQVAKFSPQHTSVQWTAESVLACQEFGALVAAAGTSALIPSCASLGACIDDAVAAGFVQIAPP